MSFFKVIFLGFLVIWLNIGCAFQKVESNQIGILVNNAFLPQKFLPYPHDFSKGIVKNPLNAGRHFYIPLFQRIELFSKSLKTIDITDPAEQDEKRRDLRLKTSEGNDVFARMILSYRVNEATASAIVADFGNLANIERDMIHPTARSVSRTTFGMLSTSQFSISAERRKMAQETIQTMNNTLISFGIEIKDVNVVGFSFNPDYEAKVREKEMFNQEAEKNIYLKKSIQAQIEARNQEAHGMKNKAVEESTGYKRQMELRAESVLFEKTRMAEGIKAELGSRAEGLLAINKALEGSGGANMVSYEIAKAMLDKEIILLPLGENGALTVTDMNRLVEKYITAKVITTPEKETTPKDSGEQLFHTSEAIEDEQVKPVKK